MDILDLLQQYYAYQKKFFLRNEVYGTISWDHQINVPAQAKQSKQEIFSLLDKEIHVLHTDKEYIHLVETLYENRQKLAPHDQRSLYIAKKAADQQTKIPEEFVERFSKLKQEAQQSFQKAKAQEDWSIFSEPFDALIHAYKQYAHHVDPDTSPIDVFLDQNEEGMTSKKIDELFGQIKPKLMQLSQKLESKPVHLYQREYDKSVFYECLLELVKKIGFDTSQGLLSVMDGYSFAINLGPQDERINFHHQDFRDSLLSVLHELGHGLYEQGAHRQYPRCNLSGGVSLSVHESQARMLENMIVRTRPFIQFVFEHIDAYFPGVFGYSLDEVYRYMTQVTARPRRIGSDEITYNLHVLLRYDIERGLFDGSIQASDVPTIWNEKMTEYLGVVPSKLSDGCLQDVHWSLGLFGYFPTYTLGNMLAAQLFERFLEDHPTWESQLVQGDFSHWKAWFSEHIREKGSLIPPQELVINITGKELGSEAFITYLTRKYPS